MIVPIGNSAAIRRLPYITFSLILINVVVFFISAAAYHEQEKVIFEYYADYVTSLNALLIDSIPEIADEPEEYRKIVEDPLSNEIAAGNREIIEKYRLYKDELKGHVFYRFGLSSDSKGPAAFISYQFIHSGIMHLIGNMWFLLLLGMNIEDVYGRLNYLIFYLAAGVISGWAFIATSGGSAVPLVGASGAISGVMGVFFYRFFREKIRFFYFLLPVKPLFGTFSLYAGFFLPLWFAQQIFDASSDSGSPVAFISHISGFLFGIITAFILSYFKIEEKYIKPKVDESANLIGISGAEQRGIEAFYTGKPGEAASILQEGFLGRPKEETFIPLFLSLVRTGRSDEAERTADIMFDAVETGKCRCKAGRILDDLQNENAVENLAPGAKFKLAKLLYRDGDIEEARKLLKDVAERDKFSILAYKALYFAVSEKIYFDGISQIVQAFSDNADSETEDIMKNILRRFNEQE